MKVAELASNSTYRESERIIKEWTGCSVSHAAVGDIVKRVGKSQSEADEAMLQELEYSAELPRDVKLVDNLYSEADGVCDRQVKRHNFCSLI